MDVRLPNGKIIRGVPHGTPKEEIARKAVMAGLATEQEMGLTEVVGIPGGPSEATPRQPATVGENIVGAGETALAALTGATTGAAGYGLGAIEGLIGQLTQGLTPEQAQKVAESYAQSLTYAPKTQAGQQQTAALGEAAAMLPPVVAGFTPTQLQGAGQAARASAAQLPQAVNQVAQAVQRAPDPSLSVGAAQVPQDVVRRQMAAELPVPIDLTKGQATRDFSQQQFEREIAKQAELGEPVRQRYIEQNQALTQNLDAFIDATGAETIELRETGLKIDKAIRNRAARDKAEIRRAYQMADKAGETSEPVNMSALADYLNQNRAGRSSAPIMNTIANELEVQGIGGGSLTDGTLAVGDITLKQAESIRKAINKFAKDNDPNDIRIAQELKSIIDDATKDAGGEMYQRARGLRSRYAQNYENIGIIKNIIGNKRGSTDRQIALEDIFNRSVLNGSRDDLGQLRRILQTEGQQGTQAWKDLQGATLNYIKDQATRGTAPDPSGQTPISAAGLERAIRNLEKGGKLEFLFGNTGAEKIRLLNDVAKDILTAPAGSVNTSNTAAVLAVFDMFISGAVSSPAPVLSGLKYVIDKVKDRNLKRRIQIALAKEEKGGNK